MPHVYENGLIPLVLGITGHRDLFSDDYPKLRHAVREHFQSVLSKYSHSPLCLLSSLAEGADRLVAEIALEEGIELGVILPMAQQDYEGDFQSEDSLAEFRSLLARADWVYTVTPPKQVEPTENYRALQYREAGLFIARHSLRLLALWDGKENGKPGGTADIVKVFRASIPVRSQSLIDIPEAGTVIHLFVRRASELGIPSEKVGSIELLEPLSPDLGSVGEIARWDEVLASIDRYNALAKKVLSQEAEAIKQRRDWLMAYPMPGEHLLSQQANAALHLHAVADLISQESQQYRGRLFRYIIGFAFVAILCEQIYSGPFLFPGWMLGALSSGLVAFFVFQRGKRIALEERYLEYRALAEACRCQLFWKIAGIPECAADHYLRAQRNELEWIRQALRTTELPRQNNEINIPGIKHLELVRINWLEDQRLYFVGGKNALGNEGANKCLMNEKADERWNKRAGRFFIAGIAATVATFVFHAFVAKNFPGIGDWIVQGLIVTYGLTFGGAAVCKAYQQTMAFSEQANRYRKIGLLFALASHRIEGAANRDNSDAAMSILIQIGQEALAESGDWLLLHRARPVEVPLGN